MHRISICIACSSHAYAPSILVTPANYTNHSPTPHTPTPLNLKLNLGPFGTYYFSPQSKQLVTEEKLSAKERERAKGADGAGTGEGETSKSGSKSGARGSLKEVKLMSEKDAADNLGKILNEAVDVVQRGIHDTASLSQALSGLFFRRIFKANGNVDDNVSDNVREGLTKAEASFDRSSVRLTENETGDGTEEPVKILAVEGDGSEEAGAEGEEVVEL